jgi:2-polyprenyl-6-hydroxyphenyl methylase/3-demethylubiquinone-9 3-methyltransferase
MNDHMPDDYGYLDAEPTWASSYLWGPVKEILGRETGERRAIEIGCGNGAAANMLSELGYEVVGVDPSESGIGQARKAYPHLTFSARSAYDNLKGEFGTFPVVMSLEVIEHCFSPREFIKAFFDLLSDGGVGVLSTPYHGYLKNIALAIFGKFDSHFSPLWDGGHIKFFSVSSLRELLIEAGFSKIEILRIGRIPPLAKSMIAIVRK